MSTERLRLTPEHRAALFHSTVFAATGAASAYLAIWLSGKGISSEQIGIVNALPVLLMLGANVLIGRLADRASDWRVAIIVLALVAGAASLGFFFVSEFWGVLLVYTAVSLPGGALIPIVDAATLRMTQRRGTDFGWIRAWGTVGYTVTSAASGALIGWLGAPAFVPVFVILSLARSGLALQLPSFRAPPHVDAVAPARATGVRLTSLMRLWFLLPLVAFALIQSTHAFIGAMGALVWKADGVAEGWFGPLIAISAAAEAIMMFMWRRVGSQMSARRMLAISGSVAALRWIAMAFSPPLPVLFALQALHAVTYPFSYFGILHFVANWAPEEIAAEAQSFASALTQGFTVITLLVFGWLVGLLGAHVYFVAVAMTFAAAGAALWSMALMPADRRDEVLATA